MAKKLGKKGTPLLMSLRIRLIEATEQTDKPQRVEVLDVTGPKVKRWANGKRKSKSVSGDGKEDHNG